MSRRDIFRILQHFINTERLTQKLSESYPFRRAAQITAYFLQKGNEKVEEFKESQTMNRLQETAQDKVNEAGRKKDASMKKVNSFMHSFFTEFNREWEKEKTKVKNSTSDKDDKKRID